MDIFDQESTNSTSNSTIYTNFVASIEIVQQNIYKIQKKDEPSEAATNNLWADLAFKADLCLFACLWGDCQQRFADREKFEAHMEAHLAQYANKLAACCSYESEATNGANSNPICQVRGCQIAVTSIEELSRHLKMHIFHANKQICGLQFIRERYPQLNNCKFPATSRLVYQGDPLICEWDNCYASFIDINDYFLHIEEHVQALDTKKSRNEKGDYCCKWNGCSATFKSRGTIRWHIQHHSGDKMCACPFCGGFFAHTSRLSEHVTRRQPGNLICHFCQKTFMDERILRRHCRRHIKQYKCQFCQYLADTPHDLNRHIQAVHAKVKNHFCDYCERAFHQKSDLNRHLESRHHLTAKEEKFHKCTFCDQQFRWMKQLREHERKHNEDYIPSPYQCHLCELRYRRGSALSKHLVQIHKLEVPIGFSRFQYKKCSDKLFRLQTQRYVRETLLMEEADFGGNENEGDD